MKEEVGKRRRKGKINMKWEGKSGGRKEEEQEKREKEYQEE